MHCPGGNTTEPIWRVLASLAELPKNLNIVTQTLSLWLISCGVLTSLLLPHLLSSHIDSLSSLNLLCHSKTDARFMQDGRKPVCGIFCKFQTEFYCISFFWSVRLHFEIHLLWQSSFSRMYSNFCCSCSFEPEIMKIGQSSYKMYSNNIQNFQEYTILNSSTKKSGNLAYASLSLRTVIQVFSAVIWFQGTDSNISHQNNNRFSLLFLNENNLNPEWVECSPIVPKTQKMVPDTVSPNTLH